MIFLCQVVKNPLERILNSKDHKKGNLFQEYNTERMLWTTFVSSVSIFCEPAFTCLQFPHWPLTGRHPSCMLSSPGPVPVLRNILVVDFAAFSWLYLLLISLLWHLIQIDFLQFNSILILKNWRFNHQSKTYILYEPQSNQMVAFPSGGLCLMV